MRYLAACEEDFGKAPDHTPEHRDASGEECHITDDLFVVG